MTLVLAGLCAAAPLRAQWKLRLEPMHMQVYGHNQHALTIHEIDTDTSTDASRAITLDTDSDIAYRGGVQYANGTWTWCLDFTWFVTSQNTSGPTVFPGVTGSELVFEIPDRSSSSTSSGETLFYQVLEDTELATWSLDLYGLREVAETEHTSLQLQLGVKFADFDNDYRAAAGVEGVGGRRIDASSNYGRMTGPLVGLAGTIRHGSHSLDVCLGQSVVIGEAELTNMNREFTGPFSEEPAFTSQQTIGRKEDVAIPITELRLRWTYRLGDHLALGLGTHFSTWWNVPVPPGVVPGPGGDQVFHENTIVYFGLLAAIEFEF